MPRARPGHTYKPCHGCGEEKHREQGSLCSSCRRLLDDAHRLAAEALERQEGRIYAWHKPGRHHNNPGFPVAAPYDQRDALELAFASLVHAASEPLPDSETVRKAGSEAVITAEWVREHAPHATNERFSTYNMARVCLPPEVVHELRRLFTAIHDALIAAYEGGKHDGHSLITRLGAGDITLDGYLERILPRGEK